MEGILQPDVVPKFEPRQAEPVGELGRVGQRYLILDFWLRPSRLFCESPRPHSFVAVYQASGTDIRGYSRLGSLEAKMKGVPT